MHIASHHKKWRLVTSHAFTTKGNTSHHITTNQTISMISHCFCKVLYASAVGFITLRYGMRVCATRHYVRIEYTTLVYDTSHDVAHHIMLRRVTTHRMTTHQTHHTTSQDSTRQHNTTNEIISQHITAQHHLTQHRTPLHATSHHSTTRHVTTHCRKERFRILSTSHVMK